MSLAIDTNQVTAVLLADGWHEVGQSSFDIDSYEFVQSPDPYQARLDHERIGPEEFRQRHTRTVVAGGNASGVTETGFTFMKKGSNATRISGPLTAILAVKERT